MTVTITDPHRWFAIRCSSGQEKRVCEGLAKLAKREHPTLEHYMPAATRWRKIRVSRKKIIREPFDTALLPGIVFVFAFPAQLGDVGAVDGVRDFYRIHNAAGEGTPAPLPAVAIEQIRRRQSEGEFDQTKPKEDNYRPSVGDKVAIGDTDWLGHLGEVLSISTKHRTAKVMIQGRRVKVDLKKLQAA